MRVEQGKLEIFASKVGSKPKFGLQVVKTFKEGSKRSKFS